ncbi:MAG: hypothetical protein ACO3ME_09345 [Ilumatobacteraceae bacterium]
MPLNPHTKGGGDVPISDGGTGAADAATVRSNLSALDETAHDALDHTGLTGIGDLTTASHAMIDHTGIMGAGGGAETESVATSPGTGINISRVISGGTLAADNESLTFELWGRNTVGGSGDVLTITWGALTIATYSVDSSFDEFMVRGTILRTGASAQLIWADGQGGLLGSPWGRFVGAEDLTLDVTITASDGSNRLAFDALIIRKWSA